MSETRERIVQATTELFSRQGYHGTGVKQIVAQANAPFASVYHFFPGGKEQVGEETIRWSGSVYEQLIDYYFQDAADLVAATKAFFNDAAEILEAGDFADPCPVATVAMETASTSEPLRTASAEVFDRWIDRTARHLAAAGIDSARGRELAMTVLALLQGAFMLGRVFRDGTPVRHAGDHAVGVVKTVLAEMQ